MNERRVNDSEVIKTLLTKNKIANVPDHLKKKRDEFEAIYKKLPSIARLLLTKYKEILLAYDLDPGEVRLYMVGGRVKGKPLQDDSDIDLIIAVENVNQSMDAIIFEGWNPIDMMEYKIIMKREVIKFLNEICAEKDVVNYFHIIGYGTSLPVQNVDERQTLLLATL